MYIVHYLRIHHCMYTTWHTYYTNLLYLRYIGTTVRLACLIKQQPANSELHILFWKGLSCQQQKRYGVPQVGMRLQMQGMLCGSATVGSCRR